MKWYIKLYKNLPNELKEDCKRKSGLYIVRHWNEHCTSICQFSISNFYNVIIKKDTAW